MAEHQDVVFLFDVDNTLLDNDAAQRDYRAHLVREGGPEAGERYWAIFEELRHELGYADYLGALQRYRARHPHDSHVLSVSSYLIDYPRSSTTWRVAIRRSTTCSSTASCGSSPQSRRSGGHA